MSADIHQLPMTGFAPANQDVAAHLREMADWIEEGDMGQIRTVILVIEDVDGSLHRKTCGHPCDLARAVGLMSMANFQAATGN